jgi:hypothetical protein
MWAGAGAVMARSGELGNYELSFEGKPEFLFTENETNFAHLYGGSNSSPYVKDAFNRYLIDRGRIRGIARQPILDYEVVELFAPQQSRKCLAGDEPRFVVEGLGRDGVVECIGLADSSVEKRIA